MSTYWVRPTPDGRRVDELRVGQEIDVDGTLKRVSTVTWQLADEDDPELDLKAGDWYCTVEFAAPL